MVIAIGPARSGPMGEPPHIDRGLGKGYRLVGKSSCCRETLVPQKKRADHCPGSRNFRERGQKTLKQRSMYHGPKERSSLAQLNRKEPLGRTS